MNLGKFNNLKVDRKVEFGYYLTDSDGNDVLLPKKSLNNKKIAVGDNVDAFIYRDSSDRIIATLKEPLLTVGNIGYLKVTDITKFGAFVSIGLERDVLVPFKQQTFKLVKGGSYLFSLYVDKTGRLAATPKVDDFIKFATDIAVGDIVPGYVYGFSSVNSAYVAVKGLYKGILVHNEYFDTLHHGQKLTVRVKKIYEDGTLSLTTRVHSLKDERLLIEDKILNLLIENNGFIPFCDASSPEEIKEVFNCSKNYFKKALGGLMKQRLITQDSEGTYLVK